MSQLALELSTRFRILVPLGSLIGGFALGILCLAPTFLYEVTARSMDRAEILLLFGFAFSLLAWSAWRSLSSRSAWISWVCTTLLVGAYLTAAITMPDTTVAFMACTSLALALGVFAGVAIDSPLRASSWFVWLCCGQGVLAAALALEGSHTLMSGGVLRLAGTYPSVNVLYVVLTMGLCAGIPWLIHRPWDRFATICGLILVSTLLLTWTRNAFFAAATVCAVLGALKGVQGERQPMRTLLVLAVLFIALLTFTSAFRHRSNPETVEVSNASRLVLWSATLDQASRSPWIGIGVRQLNLHGSVTGQLQGRLVVEPKNQVLFLFAEFGLVGVALFLGAILPVIRGLAMSRDTSLQSVGGVLIAALALGFVDTPFFAYGRYASTGLLFFTLTTAIRHLSDSPEDPASNQSPQAS